MEHATDSKFPHIFKARKLAGLTIKNAVKYAACSVSNFNTRDGFVTEREIARMKVIAATGSGLITNQGAYPDRKGEGKGYYCQLSIADDKYIPGLKRVADLIHDQHETVVLRGGKGGKGNQHFATSTNRTPRFAQPGLPGQYRRLRLSLKSIADVGLVGLPNAGKSTLLSRLTKASPKIDDYPFTTKAPNLGILHYDDRRLTLADIPGLIEGASLGKGLGHRFLKHIERTRILLYLLDMTYVPAGDILGDYHTLRDELRRFNPSLMEKTQIVALNKIDVHTSDHRDVEDLKRALEDLGVVSLTISALKGEGLEDLKRLLGEIAFD